MKVEEDGEPVIVVEPKRQAEILNSSYASVFSRRQGATATKEKPPDVLVIGEVCMDVERVRVSEQSFSLAQTIICYILILLTVISLIL